MNDERKTLVTAAGGNGTAIQIIDNPLTREDYTQRGKELGDEMEPHGAEQAGFLIPHHRHFEMAGGEFCGNASRAAAVLLFQENGQRDQTFTVSGFDGTVSATVDKQSDTHYDVRCEFPGMPTNVQQVTLSNGQKASIVDLGGIVHVVIEGEFPAKPEDYQQAHQQITQEFNLGDRDAVGVVWYTRDGDTVTMHPVVWVKAIDTFFYEESCGSGTIAVGKVTGVKSIVQPTGQSIQADVSEGKVTLQSEMEVVR